MHYTKKDAETKYPHVTFAGDCYIGDGARIGASAWIGDGASIGASAWIGDGARIGAFAWIGASARIGDGASIGDGAVIRDRASIGSISDKYVGNIIPQDDGMLIRIGCETHTVASWRAHGKSLAKKHGETEWWVSTGERIMAYLMQEAEIYLQKETTK